MPSLRLLSLISLVFLGYCVSANAQPPTPSCSHTQEGEQETLPVAVNGASTPEEIPDYLAYRHFIMAVAEHENPSAADIARRKTQFGKINLVGVGDQAAFELALQGVREQLDLLDKARAGLRADSSASHEQFVGLQRQQNALLDSVRDRIRQSLSEEGRAALDTHIREYVKRRIVVYGERPQAQ